MIDVQASEEAKALYAQLMASGEAEVLEKGAFDSFLPFLYEREGQSFPEVQVKNELGSFQLDSMDVYTLGRDDSDGIILYIHGGAWAFGIDGMHVGFCDELASSMNAKACMPLYPLAPQFDCDDAYQLLYKLYSQLSAEGKPLYLMGDSAGAHISLGLLHLLKSRGDAMPAALVLISPCAEMSFSDPRMKDIEAYDPSLRIYGCGQCAKLWAGDKPLDDALISPLNADLEGYPKTMIFFGSKDILYPNGLKLYDKLLDAAVEATFIRAEGLFHVYPIYDIPERDDAVQRITEFCR